MSTSPRLPRICVVGSSIMDLVSFAPRLPRPGETVRGSRFDTGFGGKGANQAVMAAKLGADVHMVSKVGDDPFGQDYLDNYRSWGIDVTHVGRSPSAPTGVAAIWVDEHTGANSIIVVPGANAELRVVDVEKAAPVIRNADIVVCQWEIPLPCVIAALELARSARVPTVFNPAPAQGELPDAVYSLSDVFCPNESEAELLTGASVATPDQAEAAARALLARGARTVVLTLGERGALVVDTDGARHHRAPSVSPVDTTGAGDAFVGTLATMVAAGRPLDDAVRHAVVLASESVRHPGAQSSYADRRAAPPWR